MQEMELEDTLLAQRKDGGMFSHTVFSLEFLDQNILISVPFFLSCSGSKDLEVKHE